MDLYCWPHNTTHHFTAGEVEQIVYALTGWAYDSEQVAGEYNPKRLTCPQEALRMAGDSEMYVEHVEQGVECRKDLVR